ncbi:anhydro-N-acetylmuramic acid kinase [Paracraurococcus lichenis]|uniref:Anhydro-N-acetylmuramic acid kinase n=1 Tax=Paracraurococcus lichenis TaxID=3064888 RepID=A0ABT9E6Y8_9PROT|nr:anhydro-N-acetylmuramic acid kinase [Paracraurococcus sp. LOR1-02]MDO9711949.1 anhydro-N-acetylmuramic acid kinase [Paracraurococcus sp. LOR1-02]
MLRTIGLMSGTSLDGVDAAWVETDGEAIGRIGPALTLPYDPALRRDLRRLLDRVAGAPPPMVAGALPRDPVEVGEDDPFLADCVRRLTERHAEAVEALRAEVARTLGEGTDLLGFHGQTILHRPARPGDAAPGRTWQVGDAAWLARRTGLPVAYDFRSADVAAGGQGAPLVPVVHAALAAALPKPLAVLNLGGVGNVTWIGSDGRLVAFDTGPANGPLDDWARKRAQTDYDRDGVLSLAGQPDGAVLGRLMAHPYLAAPPPKSLDRLDFDRALKEAGAPALSPQDGAATLVAFAAVCVAAAARHLPEAPLQWLVCGGGRRNPAMMQALAGALEQPVRPVEIVGWNGDALEAQAFGVLAARVVRGLPITFPGTTGAPRPLPGGQVVRP